jgi:glyoxalase/bleomycin resistance protein/dioxygenase superfamily protein
MEGILIFAGVFHHIGMACRSIENEPAGLIAIGYAAEGPPILDPIQKVRVQFFSGTGPRIELVEPAGPESPVSGILKRGAKFYHLAYEVQDFDETVGILEKDAFRSIAPASPAAAFGMRRIVFMMSKTGTLLELIEMRHSKP